MHTSQWHSKNKTTSSALTTLFVEFILLRNSTSYNTLERRHFVYDYDNGENNGRNWHWLFALGGSCKRFNHMPLEGLEHLSASGVYLLITETVTQKYFLLGQFYWASTFCWAGLSLYFFHSSCGVLGVQNFPSLQRLIVRGVLSIGQCSMNIFSI